MKKIAVVLCVVFSFAAAAFGQVAKKTVTNADLEKFRQKRLTAEQEYRDTYAAKGLPSPEELRAQSDARVKATLELADKLRAEQLEREKLATEAAARLQAAQMIYSSGAPVYYPFDNSVLSYGVFDSRFGFGRGFNRRFFPFNTSRGWYAAGGNVWPAPLGSIQQRPQPLIIRQPIIRRSGRH